MSEPTIPNDKVMKKLKDKKNKNGHQKYLSLAI